MVAMAEYPYCCGINNAYNFAGLDADDVNEWHERHVKSINYNRAAMTLVALNDGQEHNLGPKLRELGYHLLSNGAFNSKHKSNIFLYAWYYNPEKSSPMLLLDTSGDY